MANTQLKLPSNVFLYHQFFEKVKDPEWKDNPFTFYKRVHNVNIQIAKNISHLNFYLLDIEINNKIKPKFILEYIKNIEYRNFFSSNSISFKLISKNNNEWIEEENYNGIINTYNVITSSFHLFFYTDINKLSSNISQCKYYHSYRMLSNKNNYTLRFELVLNHMDIDQDLDLNIYLNMIINILRAIYQQNKLDFVLDRDITDSDVPKLVHPLTPARIVEKPLTFTEKTIEELLK